MALLTALFIQNFGDKYQTGNLAFVVSQTLGKLEGELARSLWSTAISDSVLSSLLLCLWIMSPKNTSEISCEKTLALR